MSKKKSKRSRLKRDVHLACTRGISDGRLHELHIRINVLCSRGKITPVEADEWRDRLAGAPKKGERPKPPTRPGSNLPERRQHDRMEEEHGTTVAGVLLYTSMRRKERGFSEIRPQRKSRA